MHKMSVDKIGLRKAQELVEKESRSQSKKKADIYSDVFCMQHDIYCKGIPISRKLQHILQHSKNINEVEPCSYVAVKLYDTEMVEGFFTKRKLTRIYDIENGTLDVYEFDKEFETPALLRKFVVDYKPEARNPGDESDDEDEKESEGGRKEVKDQNKPQYLFGQKYKGRITECYSTMAELDVTVNSGGKYDCPHEPVWKKETTNIGNVQCTCYTKLMNGVFVYAQEDLPSNSKKDVDFVVDLSVQNKVNDSLAPFFAKKVITGTVRGRGFFSRLFKK